ncbi:hypothetical protein KGV55_03755 [Candidatus Gracilibacteria bacterium]|nr:hypothetical protein [Candidatus Gracilibacteria bacterium]
MEKYYFIVSILFFIGLIFWAVAIIHKYSRRKKLSAELKKTFLKHFGAIQQKKNNPKEQIINYDKLYHKVLQGYGYQGSFGEILKTEPNEIGNIQRVWNLHKLRNKLVHEFDLMSVAVLKKKVGEYEKELRFLMK